MKIVYYKRVKVTINVPGLVEVIINMIIYYRGVPESVVTDQELLFKSKFWFLLCYFLKIKKKAIYNFPSLTDGQMKRQNSMIEAYLRAFLN